MKKAHKCKSLVDHFDYNPCRITLYLFTFIDDVYNKLMQFYYIIIIINIRFSY
jgi:hypothetical protein